mgnify:CR=1 FL=1
MLINTNLLVTVGTSHTSCGIAELYGLSDGSPEEMLLGTFRKVYSSDGYPLRSIILFSDATQNGWGQALADTISANKLGTIVETPAVRNLNSGNMIKAWLFCPNYEAFKAWVDKIILVNELPATPAPVTLPKVTRARAAAYVWGGSK